MKSKSLKQHDDIVTTKSSSTSTPIVFATPVDVSPSSSWDDSSVATTATTISSFIENDIKKDAIILYIDKEIVCKEIGYGPSRFAIDTTQQLSVYERINSLTMEEKMCYDNLKCKWEELYQPFPYIDWYLRFAKCSPGVTKYNETTAWKAMIRFHHKYSNIFIFNIQSVEKQIWNKTVFPIPGLKTLHGEHEVLYFRPSHFANIVQQQQQTTKTTTAAANTAEILLDSIVYVMNTMLENEKSCTEGISLLINMKDYKANNYQFFYQFLVKVLRGNTVPVRIRSIMILHSPIWLQNKIWLLRPILSKELKEKIFFINHENELSNYLMNNYIEYLPDDISNCGKVNTDDIVRDYIVYRRYIEHIRCMNYDTQDHNDYEQQQLNSNMSSRKNIMIGGDRKNQVTTTPIKPATPTVITTPTSHAAQEQKTPQQYQSLHYTSKKKRMDTKSENNESKNNDMIPTTISSKKIINNKSSNKNKTTMNHSNNNHVKIVVTNSHVQTLSKTIIVGEQLEV